MMGNFYQNGTCNKRSKISQQTCKETLGYFHEPVKTECERSSNIWQVGRIRRNQHFYWDYKRDGLLTMQTVS